VDEPQIKDTPVVKDALDEALPAGALARLGTLRWRHGAPVTFLALTPDGKTLVSAADDRLVHIWDFATGKELLRLGPGKVDLGGILAPGTTGTISRNLVISALAVAADGKLLATHFGGADIQLWDITGNKLKTIPLAKGQTDVGALAFAPDGKQLAVAGSDGTVRLWDLQAEKFVRTLEKETGDNKNDPAKPFTVSYRLLSQGSGGMLVYAPNGKILAVVLRDLVDKKSPNIRLWDMTTGKVLHTIEVAGRPTVGFPAFSPDSKACAFTKPGEVVVVEAATGKVLHELRLAEPRGNANVVFADDSATLYTREVNGALRQWDLKTGKELRRLAGTDEEMSGVSPPPNPRGCLALSADGKTLLAGGNGLAIRLIDLATGKELPTPGGHLNQIAFLSYAPDGKALVTYSSDHTVRVWDPAAGKQLRQVSMPADIRQFASSADGRILAVADGRVPDMPSALKLIDAENGKEIARIADQATDAAGLVFAPDGRTLAVQRRTGIVLYDVPSGKERTRVAVPADPGNGKQPRVPVSGYFFAPDGGRIAVLSGPKSVTIYDTTAGQVLQKFEWGNFRYVRSAVFSPDGRTLGLDSGDGFVHLMELATGKERRAVGKALPKPEAPAGIKVGVGGGSSGPAIPFALSSTATFAFSPDSRVLAHGFQQTMTVWDMATGEALASFDGHRGNIGPVAFAPDGRSVATGSGDTTAIIWDVAGLSAKAGPSPQVLAADAAAARWADLTSDDAALGYEAICRLIAAPKQAVPLLAQRLQAAPAVKAERIDKLIDELGNGEFKVRQKAQAELQQIGEPALPQLKKALGEQVPLETRQRLEILYAKLATLALTGDRLRLARAVEVLERIGSAEARQVLQTLADGGPRALATTQAAAALQRLHQ
jgi:WD40 repeat protein